jgi:hypothetical protein
MILDFNSNAGSAERSGRLQMMRRALPAVLTALMMTAGIPVGGGGKTSPLDVSRTAGRGDTQMVFGPAVASVRLQLPPSADPITKNIAAILAHRIEERSAIRVITSGTADLNIDLTLEPGIGSEGYAISDAPAGGIRIAGNDERGLFYGVGKFLRTSVYDKKRFVPSLWRGRSIPSCPVRGIYFAVHGNNFYEAAPAAEV